MDTDRAVALLKERLEELSRLLPDGESVELPEWKSRSELTLRRIFADDHYLVSRFQRVHFLYHYGDEVDYYREGDFESGRAQASALLKGAVYELEELSALRETDEDGAKNVPLGEVLCAAICARGHVQNAFIEHNLWNVAISPSGYLAPHVPPFCGRCGARVLLCCGNCELWIAGQTEGHPPDPAWEPAAFCWKCGRPYPWATQEQLIGQLYNLLDFEDLDDAERLTVVEQIAVLSEPVDEVTDDDRVRAGQRIRNLAPKAWEAALPVLQSLLTAEAKRRLELPP